jgi:hypothetical protein
MDELLNVLQSIQLPFALLPILHFTSHVRLMGPFVNSKWMQYLGRAIVAVVVLSNFYLVSVTLQETMKIDHVDSDTIVSHGILRVASSGVCGGIYLAFIGYLIHQQHHDIGK